MYYPYSANKGADQNASLELPCRGSINGEPTNNIFLSFSKTILSFKYVFNGNVHVELIFPAETNQCFNLMCMLLVHYMPSNHRTIIISGMYPLIIPQFLEHKRTCACSSDCRIDYVVQKHQKSERLYTLRIIYSKQFYSFGYISVIV